MPDGSAPILKAIRGVWPRVRLHWHRRDLRVTDNAGLAAIETGPIVPCFVLDPTVLEHASPPREAFLLDALESLRAGYRARGGDLLIRRGAPTAVLPALASEHGAEAVSWTRDYSGLARRRDAVVAEALATEGVETETVHDAVHHPPGTITTNDGDPYRVFSYYAGKWRDRPTDPPYDPPGTPDAPDPPKPTDAPGLADVGGDPIPTAADLGVAAPEADLPPAGTDHAMAKLEAFCAGPIYRYAAERDRPDLETTSRLSAPLRFGTIGIRTVTERVERAREAAPDEDARESVEEFRDQLAWREFYTQVLWDRPDVVHRNYREFTEPIAWREDPAGLQAWKDGETGYPLVDAGMRQLRREAWMHNRVRMVVASFLTKDLLIDWRAGYDWFRERLVDHDPANDSGGWQWAASTGTDAQPYFRIFNPTSQCERHDPEGEYVREYVPELADAPTRIIHEWPGIEPAERREHAPEYPDPIVDHAERREAALAMFRRARGEEESD